MATPKILSIPKKLRDVFALLRKGQITRGLDQLGQVGPFEKMDAFAAHIAVARAEIAYFQHDFARAMTLDEEGLPLHDRWYAGNVVDEHFVAYVRAATTMRRSGQAGQFLKTFLKREKELRVPASDKARHTFHVDRFKRAIGGLQKRLKGKMDAASFVPAYRESSAPKPMAAFVEQLKKYRPKLSAQSVEGAEYMLHFVYEAGRAADYLSLYEPSAIRITNMDHHIHAAKVYLATDHPALAMKAIRTMTAHAWYHVEEMQVAPMQLWAHDDLAPILTPKFCRELLELPKGQR